MVEISTLSLSDGCFGALRASLQNTTVYVFLDLLGDQEKNNLFLQTYCIVGDSNLYNCTMTAERDCTDVTRVTCEHWVVRLAEGHHRCAGRVELLDSGEWGTVCDDNFDLNAGNIVCGQLKCGNAVTLGPLWAGRGAIHISKMKCNGSESNLWQCAPRNNSDGYCGHKNDVWIVCSESIESRPTANTSELSSAQATGGCEMGHQTNLYQNNEQIGVFQLQYECLGQRLSSNNTMGMDPADEKPDSSFNSDNHPPNTDQRHTLHRKLLPGEMPSAHITLLLQILSK
ncbi:hypothetical protein DNTS_022603 [Danionella cerebrum]|uniref:SRCR domain-containing protein n=1 Tax=Danionella cerebrum TaxID=2873325 RepID=A0A553QA78_9TELE|nr:hypothetical protein DNTS_022603 [Danionella translucida]